MTAYIASLITDALTEFAYDAELAGLSYGISEAADGLSLTVGGYNEKAHVLLKRVLEKARTLVIDPDRFEVTKEQVPFFVPLQLNNSHSCLSSSKTTRTSTLISPIK
jgi:insulysin